MFGMLTSCNHGTKCAAEPGVKRSEEVRETLCVHSFGAKLLVWNQGYFGNQIT